MKKRKINSTAVALWALTAVTIVICFAIIALNIRYQTLEDWKDILIDLLNSLLSVVLFGGLATLFTQIITNHILEVKRNNDKLKEFGVEFIGGGRSTPEDTRNLFGHEAKKRYPSEIKIMFLSGNGFFVHFEKELLECIRNSDCTVKILLLSTDPSNQKYAKRMEDMCPQKTTYFHQVDEEAIPVLQSIMSHLDESKKSQLKLRFYKDEYRYNFRIAKYCDGDNVLGKCWLNVQPFNRDAIDVSVGLNGGWDDKEKLDNNIYKLLDMGFNDLWYKYEDTEYIFE